MIILLEGDVTADTSAEAIVNAANLREYIAQMLFATEIVSARKADREDIP